MLQARHYPEVGQRRCEVRVDLNRGIITIQRAKHGARRDVQVNTVVRIALEKLWSMRDDTGRICSRCQPKIHRTWWGEILKEARISNFR
jgi:hypothetical protein